MLIKSELFIHKKAFYSYSFVVVDGGARLAKTDTATTAAAESISELATFTAASDSTPSCGLDVGTRPYFLSDNGRWCCNDCKLANEVSSDAFDIAD